MTTSRQPQALAPSSPSTMFKNLNTIERERARESEREEREREREREKEKRQTVTARKRQTERENERERRKDTERKPLNKQQPQLENTRHNFVQTT